MKYVRRLAIASVLAAGLSGVALTPSHAATDALDQTFQAVVIGVDASTINGSVNIPTLTAGSAVTGGGTMTITWNGMTIYDGGFTATSLKSITPYGQSSYTFSALPTTTQSYSETVSPYGIPWFNVSTTAAAPVATSGLGLGVQIVADASSASSSSGVSSNPTVPATQDLFLDCSNAHAVLDIGITLTDPVSSDAALYLADNPNMLLVSFPAATGTSVGSAC